MDSVIEEICRARGPEDIRPSKLRDWQDYLRNVIQPQLDAQAAPVAVLTPRRTRVSGDAT